MFATLSSTLFFLYPFIVNAANDWNTACVGSCSYESGDGVNKAWSTVLIDGAPEVISDISTAAGWSIMDCHGNSTEPQDIRIVCHNPDGGCEQLFDGGAVNTIVRLPEECADAPFARIVSITTSSNQTLTQDVARLIQSNRRRRSQPPEVLNVTIDYNFHLIPTTRGTVSLTALATTNPLQRPMTNTQALRRALGYSESGELNARSGNSAGELVTREILRRDLFADFVGGNVIPDGITWGDKNSTASTKRDNEARWLDWEDDWNHQYDVINIQQAFPVVDAGISCPQNGDIPAFDAKITIDADVNARATVTVGFIVAGSVIPPEISKAAFTAALDGGIQAAFNISAVAQGSFSTGLLPLYSSGLAGMSIPGILDLGPTFSVNGQADGVVTVSTDALVTANYQFPGLSMVYPQDQGNSTGQASHDDTKDPLTLSVGGSTSLQGRVSVHLIPRVDLGVSVLAGAASASVFLELDGYGELNMGLTVSGSPSTTVDPTSTANVDIVSTSTPLETASTPPPVTAASTNSTSEASETTDPSPTSEITTPPVVNDVALPPPEAAATTSTEDDANVSEAPSSSPAATAPTETCSPRRLRRRRRQQPTEQKRDLMLLHEGRGTSDSYSGCVGVNMGVKIVAGAQGRLFSFWHDTDSFDPFSVDWPIFNKCFGGSTKRDLPQFHGPFIPTLRPPAAHLDSKEKRQLNWLVCPALTGSLSALQQIV